MEVSLKKQRNDEVVVTEVFNTYWKILFFNCSKQKILMMITIVYIIYGHNGYWWLKFSHGANSWSLQDYWYLIRKINLD